MSAHLGFMDPNYPGVFGGLVETEKFGRKVGRN